MIITVTMNPAIDKTVNVENLRPGTLNRVSESIQDIGGKGINVSLAIKALKGESLASGFLGKENKDFFINNLKKNEVKADFVEVDGMARTNLKVINADGTLTEINEPGPVIHHDQIEELILKLESYAGEGNIFVLSGSVSKGMDKDIYALLTRRLKALKSEVIVDADGELFKKAVEEVPTVIKPNTFEITTYYGIDEDSSDELIIEKCQSLLEKGIRIITVSKGKDGALFITKEGNYLCPALQVKISSTVGAGDAMVAALAYALEQKLSIKDTIALAMAMSSGACTTEGTKPPTLSLVEELKKEVIIKKLS